MIWALVVKAMIFQDGLLDVALYITGICYLGSLGIAFCNSDVPLWLLINVGVKWVEGLRGRVYSGSSGFKGQVMEFCAEVD